MTPVQPFYSPEMDSSSSASSSSSTKASENLRIQEDNVKSNTEQQKELYIINPKPSHRSRKSDLFDELIEIVQHPETSKDEWPKFEKKLDEYVIDQYSCLCVQSAHKRKRKFLQQCDKKLLYPVHHAVLNNNQFMFKTLFEDYGCDINIRTLDYDTVLILAARARSIWEPQTEKNVSSSQPVTSSNTDLSDKKTDLIEYLLNKVYGGNVNAIDAYDDEHRTALHHAILHRRWDYMVRLIDFGADIKIKTTLKATVLHLVCFWAKDDRECCTQLKILFKKLGQPYNQFILQKDTDGLTAVCIAAGRSFEQSVEELLKMYQCSPEDQSCDIELEHGVSSNNKKILDKIYQKHKSCSYHQGKDTYKYLLHLAAKFNNDREVYVGANDNEHNQQRDNVSHIISTTYSPNAWEKPNVEGYMPVHIAAHYGNNAFIQYAIKNVKDGKKYVCQTTQNRRKINALHICAEQSISSPLSPDETKTEKNTNTKHLEICKTLLSLNSPYVEILFQAGDNDKNTPLHLAARKDNKEVFTYLLKHGKKLKHPNLKDDKEDNMYGITEPHNCRGRTPLFECAEYNHISLMEELLSTDANSKTWKETLDQLKDENKITCLHIACNKGSLDAVKYLVSECQVSVNVRGANQQTPLYGACEWGFLSVVQYLLGHTDADPTLRTAKGYNCLDIAIAKHHPEIVERLLKYPDWRTLMESVQYDGSDAPITPMRRLIISMPEIAYELIDKHFKTVIGDADQPKHIIKYDYTFIDDHYNICDWQLDDHAEQLGSKWRTWFRSMLSKLDLPERRHPYTPIAYILLRNHPLLLMSQCNQEKLMSHPLCVALRKAKFRRFSRWILALFFLSYIMFMTLYTVVVLQTIHPQYYYDLYNSSGNTSGQIIEWDYGFSENLCQRVGTYLLESGNTDARKTTNQQRYIFTLDVLLIVFVIKNALFILASFPRFVRKIAYYTEGCVLLLVFLCIRDEQAWQHSLNFRCPIQWELGSIGLLLSWLVLLSYLRYIPWMDIGLYVVMLEVIFLKFLRAIPLLMVLFCGFGFTYYMLLQYEAVYATPFEALFRTTLSLFDSGYESRLYNPPNDVMYYPVIYFVFILTVIILTILVTNMLIGLAVGEIPTLKTQAALQRNKMLYELFFDYEVFHLQLKIIARAFLYFLTCRACRSRSNSSNQSRRTKRAFSLYEVHVNNEINVDESLQTTGCIKKFLKWLRDTVTEDDIQSLIVVEKEYKKNHKGMTKENDQEDE
ncbi:hypothetical protein I4U23_023112 [Adineta vaga]|nr:hypothetical protein I4U23_023112 [Adineta vaga]